MNRPQSEGVSVAIKERSGTAGRGGSVLQEKGRYTGAGVYELLSPFARWNLPEEELSREAVTGGEGVLTPDGALAVRTGRYTGRSPKDKFTVRRPPSEAHIDWSGDFNRPFPPERVAP